MWKTRMAHDAIAVSPVTRTRCVDQEIGARSSLKVRIFVSSVG